MFSYLEENDVLASIGELTSLKKRGEGRAIPLSDILKSLNVDDKGKSFLSKSSSNELVLIAEGLPPILVKGSE